MNDFISLLQEVDLLGGFLLNLQLTALAGAFSLLLGMVLAAMQISPITSLRWASATYVNVVRNIPLTLIVVFCVLVLWPILKVQFSADFQTNFFWLAVVGLSAYHATFACEAIRSGVNTVPIGQAEAARAIGLSFVPAARLVILPQALRGAVVPLGSALIALVKNSTVAAVGSVVEVSARMRELIESNGNLVLAIFAATAMLFVIVVVPLGYLLTWLSKRLAVQR